MNSNGLLCSTLMLCTLTLHGCTQLNSQVAKVKSTFSSSEKSENMLAAARTLESQKEWIGARKKYEECLKRDPRNVKACHRLGIVCTQLGDTVAATRYFTQARQLAPTNSELLNDFGFALYKRGQYEAAEKVLAAALQNDANNPKIMNNLALTVGHQGRFKESYTMFRNLMSEAEAHANVAYIHTQRGEGNLALKEYDLALTADPTLKSAGLAAAELAQLKNRHLENQALKADQQLAATSPAKEKQQPAKKQQQPESAKTQQIARLKPTTTPAQPKAIPPKKSPVKQELISQVSMKKEVKREIPLETKPELKREKKVVKQEPTLTRRIPQEKPTQEAAPLEINPFRSLDEISEEEAPVIIRISNETAAKESGFRTPQELSAPSK